MQPGDRPLRHPTKYPQTTAMLRVSFGQLGIDATPAQFLPMWLRIVGPIPVDLLGASLRFSALVQGPAAIHQGHQLLDLGHVCGRDLSCQGNALGIHQDMLLEAGTAAIRRVWATALDSTKGSREGAIDGAARPVNLVRLVQAVEQHLVELEPDTGLLPGLESAPAGHATATAHLDGEILPGDAGLEDEQDTREGLAILDGLASGVAEAAWLGGR